MEITYVVIGAGGFVGRKLVQQLSAVEGVQVVAFDYNLDHQPALPDVTYIQGDIRSPFDVSEATRAATCVIHLASFGMSGAEMLSHPKKVQKINVEGTMNVIDCCLSNGVSRLVYVSTVNVVFGGQEIERGDETMPYFPLENHVDSYSRSKAEAEKLVLEANGVKTKMGNVLYTCALRPNAIYGRGEMRHFPRIVDMMEKNLFIFAMGSPSSHLQYIHADNLVKALILAAKCLTDKPRTRGAAYFIVDDPPVNQFLLVKPLAEDLGFPFPKVWIPVKIMLTLAKCIEFVHQTFQLPWAPLLLPAEIFKASVHHTFSGEKAKRELGYVGDISIEDGFREMFDDIVDRRLREMEQNAETPRLLPFQLVAILFYLSICGFGFWSGMSLPTFSLLFLSLHLSIIFLVHRLAVVNFPPFLQSKWVKQSVIFGPATVLQLLSQKKRIQWIKDRKRRKQQAGKN